MKEFRISDDAVSRLRSLKASSAEARPDHAVRVYMDMHFCGGPQWGFMLSEYDEKFDECCDFDGFRIIVDRDLLEAMGGLDVSLLEEDAFGDSFLVTPLDPNVQEFFEASKHTGCNCSGGCSGCGGGCSSCGCDDCDCSCDDDCGCSCDDDCDCSCGQSGCSHCHAHDDDEY